jgi:NAD(P)-dependent dehydrogenase (short-subunit alcohol dehydrogenase family)
LGEATTREIVKRGGKVVIFDMEQQGARADSIMKEIGGDVKFVPVNVTDEDGIVKAVAAAGAAFGAIHGNINCVSHQRLFS